MKSVLIIRFSSFGDILQSLHVVLALKQTNPNIKISFLTKSVFEPLVRSCPYVDNVIVLKKKSGILELIKLALLIRKNNFELIYDAHKNIRTLLIKLINIDNKILVRSKNRLKRILLFKFRKNYFPKPFVAADSYLEPLNSLNIKDNYPCESNNLFFKNTSEQYYGSIAICPSAAWDTKRWPIEKWNKLIQLIAENRSENIVILGGPEDDFCKDFEKISNKVTNLAGNLTLLQSCEVISKSKFVIAGDTGLIQVADILGKKGIELIGPSAFGYPKSDSIKVIETSLDCKPCSKDGSNGCSQDIYKNCMQLISVESVYSCLKNNI